MTVDFTQEKWEYINFFMEGVANAINFARDADTFKAIVMSEDCYEATVTTPLDVIYMRINRVTDKPAPNLLDIKDETSEQKAERLRIQKVFRKWWSSAMDYVSDTPTAYLEILTCEDDMVEFKAGAKDGGILHMLLARKPLEEVA